MNQSIRRLIAIIALAAPFAHGTSAPAPSVLCRAELDRRVLRAEQTQTAVLKISIDAPDAPPIPDRPAVNLAVVLDRSGSMSGAKLERAKEAAIAALYRLDARDRFALITYDDTVKTVVPAQSAANAESIEPLIRSIEAGGSTSLFGGVSQGAAEIRRALDPHFVHRIILLSDGRANRGPQTPDDLGRLGAALFKDGISVSTVGIGNDYNEDLMTQLALNSDGNTYFVQHSDELPRIFAVELRRLLSVVAKRVKVTIECPEGIRPIRLIGRDGRIHAHRVELSLNQLYGKQQKYALLEVEIPAVMAGETRHIATANVSYENAVEHVRQFATARAEARFTSEELEVLDFRNGNYDVQRALILNTTAIEVNNAIKLADDGQSEAAAQNMLQQVTELRDLNVQLKDPQLRQRAAQVEQQAQELESKGWNQALRKSVVTFNAGIELQMDEQSDAESERQKAEPVTAK